MDLEAERDRLVSKWQGRKEQDQDRGRQHITEGEGIRVMPDGGQAAPVLGEDSVGNDQQEAWEMTNKLLQHISIQIHSRGRHSTMLTSCSRSSSSSKHRQSKWSLKKYTMVGKEVRRLNAYELIGASIRWALDIEGLSVHDYRALLDHLNFITIRAMHDDFRDSAHIEYDLVVRRLAESNVYIYIKVYIHKIYRRIYFFLKQTIILFP